MLPAHIPSPSQGVVHLGPVPIRAYALCIILGVVVAAVVGDRRFQARGGRSGGIADVATWAVPFGLVGARLYHLATNSELYWGNKNGQGTVAAFEIWHGGLGIWGGVLFGALGAWIACKRYGFSYAIVADSLAPALPLAQGIGRIGNYFNQELYGRPTSLPWGLHIDLAHRPMTDTGVLIQKYAGQAYYHPTFLYELIWDVIVALLVIYLDRRHHFNRGRAFALYVALYTFGRFWVESLRIDDAHRFLGLRLNDWTSIVVFICAVAYFVLVKPADPAQPADSGTDDEASSPSAPGHTLTA